MQTLAPYVELPSRILVHALAEPATPMNEQTPEWLRWKRFNNPASHFSGKPLTCGHTKGATIRNHGHAICIDTGAYEGGWLTCLELETGQIVQASQKAKAQRSSLADWQVS